MQMVVILKKKYHKTLHYTYNKSSTTGNTHVFNNTPDIWLNYMSDLSVTPSEDSLYFYDVDW